jgi:hypothetical protein
VQTKTTYWIDPADNPLIIHENGSIVIEINDSVQGQALDVFLDQLCSVLFGERWTKQSRVRKLHHSTRENVRRLQDN